MEELDAKRLLRENTRLINERNELYDVLGEEKEMVRYLHGVIKNYEHLLRSNSQRRQNRYRPRVYRNTSDTEIDPELIFSSKISENVPSYLHKPLKGSSSSENKKMASLRLGSFEERHHAMLDLQTVKGEVKQQDIPNKVSTSVQDDACLEDLEILSISSTEEPSDDSCLVTSDEMESKRYSERKPSKKYEKHSITSLTFDGISRDGRPNKSDNYHRLNDDENYQQTGKTADKDSIRHVTRYDQSYLESSLDNELEELNKVLDRIASKIKKHENSLERSEKHLGKMEHRMEYLESFALGKESEYL